MVFSEGSWELETYSMCATIYYQSTLEKLSRLSQFVSEAFRYIILLAINIPPFLGK